MVRRKRIKIINVFLLAAIALAQIPPAEAGEYRHQRSYSDHSRRDRSRSRNKIVLSFFAPRRVKTLCSFSTGVFTLAFGGAYYYYCDGYYYQRRANEYILVEPPLGVIVPALPPVYETVIVNGVPYYVNGGVYYRYTAHGYEVTSVPVVRQVVTQQPIAPQPIIQQSAVVTAPAVSDSFSVNVPNASGGYTQVVLKKSGNGYNGPQGEYYPEFPPIEQLRVMYGK